MVKKRGQKWPQKWPHFLTHLRPREGDPRESHRPQKHDVFLHCFNSGSDLQIVTKKSRKNDIFAIFAIFLCFFRKKWHKKDHISAGNLILRGSQDDHFWDLTFLETAGDGPGGTQKGDFLTLLKMPIFEISRHLLGKTPKNGQKRWFFDPKMDVFSSFP